MTFVQRINHLREFGIFRDFKRPRALPDFGRYNLIYGWNGSGKTTLSRLLRDLELRRQPQQGRVSLLLDGRDVDGESFSTQENLQLRVFNRDYVNASVFTATGADMQPILVLGKESIEKQEELERLRARLESARASESEARSEAETTEDAVDKFCKKQARDIKELFKTSEKNPYENFNKRNFHDKANFLASSSAGQVKPLSDAERAELLDIHRGQPKVLLEKLVYSFPDIRKIEEDLRRFLATEIASPSPGSLQDDPDLADWIRQGLAFFRDRDEGRCLFCHQEIPEPRLAALESHFNSEYERFNQELDQAIRDREAERNLLRDVRPPAVGAFWSNQVSNVEAVVSELEDQLRLVARFIEEAVKALKDKKERAFEKVPSSTRAPSIASDVVSRLNTEINRHNERCGCFEKEVKKAQERLLEDRVERTLEEFGRLRGDADRASKKLSAAQEKVKRLEEEIAGLERDVVEYRKPAEELNSDLADYLGHRELYLEIRETGYTLTRGGAVAETVSEGERTAIALLYFLKSLQDERFDLKRAVVVLDDPVSSLDANSLFAAFAFIRSWTEEAKQLFILTHNHSFFRQVRNWFGHMNRGKDEPKKPAARFFMLEPRLSGRGRVGIIRELDDLLKEYETDYQYLFARILDASVAASGDLAENYPLPNMARRMLETFLAFRQPDKTGGLWQRMEAVEYPDAKKIRILRFLHTHSHSDGVGASEDDMTALAEVPKVLGDLLGMIEAEDKDHYLAMKRLVRK